MKEPTRWCEPNSGASREIRELLRETPDSAPSSQQVEAIWSGLSARIAVDAAAPGTPHSPGTASASTGAAGAAAAAVGKIKLLALVAATGGVVATGGYYGWQARQPPAPAARSTAAVAATRPRPVPTAGEPQTVARAEAPLPLQAQSPPPAREPQAKSVTLRPAPPRAHARPAVALLNRVVPSERDTPAEGTAAHEYHPSVVAAEDEAAAPLQAPTPKTTSTASAPLPAQAPPPAPRLAAPPSQRVAPAATENAAPVISVNQLVQESRCLDAARNALRTGDADLALRRLRACSPEMLALVQEREALTIEALAMKPALRDSARGRARAFLIAYPDSPYRGRIKGIALDPK